MNDISFPKFTPNISSARWCSASGGVIVAEIEGQEVHVPDDPKNSDRQAIAVWETEGNVIAACASVVPDIETARNQALLTVSSYADSITAHMTSGISRAERDSWPLKFLEATAFAKGTLGIVDCPVLSAEASLTGENINNLAASVSQKARSYQMAAGLIAGFRRTTSASVAAATSIEAIESVLSAAKERADNELKKLFG